jgi:hypothetical protein
LFERKHRERYGGIDHELSEIEKDHKPEGLILAGDRERHEENLNQS